MSCAPLILSAPSLGSDSPLTEREHEFIRLIGHFALANSIPLILEAVLWGIYLILASKAVGILCKGGHLPRARPRQALLVVTLVLFIFSTVHLATFLWGYFVQISRIVLGEYIQGQTFKERASITFSSLIKAGKATSVLFPVQWLFGDAIVIWRTWAVAAKGNRRFISFLIVLWFICLVLIVTAGGLPRKYSPMLFLSSSEIVFLVEFILSAITNLLSIAFIAHKLRQYRRTVQIDLGDSASKSQISPILVMLVESGTLFFIIWLLHFVLMYYSHHVYDYSTTRIVSTTLDYAIGQIMGLYPTTIIILVEKHRSICDTPHVSAALSTLRFASRGDVEHSGQDESKETGSSSSDNAHVRAVHFPPSEDTIKNEPKI